MFKDILFFVQHQLFKITGADDISGFIVLIFHWGFVFFTGFYILFGPVDYYYWVSCFIFFLYALSNIYFHGCLFLKMERYLFNDKEWFGVWNLYDGITAEEVPVKYWQGVAVGSIITIFRNTTRIRGLLGV